MSLEPKDVPFVRRANEGSLFGLGFADVRIVLGGSDTGGAFAMSRQALQPRALAGPLHRHANEAGFIYVLNGSIGAQVDQQVVRVEPGDTVLVPTDARHTFWNESDAPSEVLEIFTPAGLEKWFGELAEIVGSGSFGLDDIVDSAARYGTYLDLDSIGSLVEAHHLTFASAS